MKTKVVAAIFGILLLASLAVAESGAPAPPNPVSVSVGGQPLELWPYTATDFSGTPSDPINLIFPDADPRALRQALLGLDGARPPFAALPFGSCTWTDAMGEEQAAWAETKGWVGSAVQLACVKPGFPLGDPFRVHLRLFREGSVTLGAAHLDVLIPGTAQHESLGWELPRVFVTYDMGRTGVLTSPPTAVSLFPPGTFGAVPRLLYDGLVNGGAGGLLAALGLTPPPSGDVPIPTSGTAAVLVSQIAFEPKVAHTRTETQVTYNVNAPKPFCNGPTDFVHIAGGPLRLVLRTHTDAAGGYSRTYTVSGLLDVTPLPAGETVQAVAFEEHLAMMTDVTSEATEIGSRILLAEPTEALSWILNAGHLDRYTRRENCAQ